MSDKKNVFIVGLDDFNLQKLRRLPGAGSCEFHAALSVKEIREVEEFDIEGLIERAYRRIEEFDGSVDAIATYYDFPGTTIAPILCERFGLPGPSLRSVLTCEHKYWSRMEQQKAIPDHIPQFQAFDPFDDKAFDKIELIPPFWIKPNKSFRSFLAYKINGPGHFRDAMQQVRQQIRYLGAPFNRLMDKYGMPPELVEMGNWCIAEAPLSGSQVTVEGYSHQGRVVGYGVVDSVREEDRSSLARYDYPSSLPLEVKHRMIDISRQAIQQIGLDNSPFNIEFFYDQTHDGVFLLEINPRVSQAHTDVFEQVHGASHLRVMLDLALGRKPKTFDRSGGKFNMASNFMLRVYEPGRVTRVPTPEEIAEVIDGGLATHVQLRVKEQQHLIELKGQDSYSFELANIFIGGRDQLDILEKYDHCLERLGFRVQRDPEPILRRRPRQTIVWNGTDLPPELAKLPAGTYVLESAG